MRRLVLLPVVSGVLLVGCRSGTATGASTTSPAAHSGYVELYASLCDATAAARDGDSGNARTVFFDRVHQSLHGLAADVATEDRPVAAALHEAKQAAEAALRSGEPAADPLTRLTEVAYDAVAAVAPAPSACNSTTNG